MTRIPFRYEKNLKTRAESLTCDRNHELIQWMSTSYSFYRDQVVDETVGVGYEIAWTDFDVQCDGTLVENVLWRKREEKWKQIVKTFFQSLI
jgi:hypothetical protein